MTITPVATTDVANYVSSPDGTKKTTDVVIAVNADGTAIAAGGGTGASASQVQGAGASGAAAVGNPVGIGGVYNAVVVSPATGQRVDLQMSSKGRVLATVALAGTAADGSPNSFAQFTDETGLTPRNVGVYPFKLGGLASAPACDRDRGLMEGVVLASAAKTTAQSVDFVNYLPRASLHIIINVTAGSGFSITPKIRARDPIVTTEYYDLLAGIAITATGRTVLKVGPGIAVAANAAASDMVPRNLNFQMAVADATSATYSVAYVLG